MTKGVGRGGVAVLVSAGLLVAGVLLVRPGTRAPAADLTLPTTAPSALPTETEPPLPDVDELRQLRPADLQADGTGVGPFRLGAALGDLVETGWQRVDQADGCTRLRGAEVQDAVEDPAVAADLRLDVDVIGLPLDAADAAGAVVPEPGPGCRSAAAVDPAGRTVTTSALDDVVVAQQVDRPGRDPAALELEFTAVDGAAHRDVTVSTSTAGGDGRPLRYELVARERFVPALDGGVLVAAPTVWSRVLGEECTA